MEIQSSRIFFGCSHRKLIIAHGDRNSVNDMVNTSHTADPSVDCYVSDIHIKNETPFY